MPKKSSIFVALFIAVLITSQGMPAFGSLMDITPDKPLLFFQLTGAGSMISEDSNFWQQVSQAPFWEIVYAELEIQSKMKNVHLAIEPGVSMISRIFGEDIVFVLPQFQNIVAISPLLMLRLRDSGDDLGGIISSSIEIALSNAPGGAMEYGGYKITTIPLPEGVPVALSCALLDDVIAIGLGNVTIRKVIDLMNGSEGAVSIKDDPEFAAIMAKIPQPENSKTDQPLMVHHVDTAKIVAFANSFYPLIQGNLPGAVQMIAGKALQWFDLVSSVSSRTTITDEGLTAQRYVTLNPDATSQNFLKMLQAEPDLSGSMAFVPEDAVAYAGTNLANPKLIWEMLYSTISDMPEISGMALGQLAQMEQQLGISLEEDLFSWMGNEVAYVANDVGASLSANFGNSPFGEDSDVRVCLLLKVTDREKAQAGLQKVTDLFTQMSEGQLVIQKQDYMGEVIYVPAELPIPIKPGYALVDNYLLIGPSVDYIQSLIDCAAGRSAQWDSNPRFMATKNKWPGAVNTMQLFDIHHYVNALTESAKPAFAQIVESGPGNMDEEQAMALGMLPQILELANILNQSFGASVGFAINDGEGLKSTAFMQIKDLESVTPVSDPTDVQIARNLFIANRYAENEMQDQAADRYSQVLKLDESNWHALMGMAKILSAQGKHMESKEYWSRMGFVSEDSWHIIGPFEYPDEEGALKQYPPEEEVNLEAEYEVVENAIAVKWEKIADDSSDGYVDLYQMLDPNEWAIAYAYTEITAPEACEAEIRSGSDDQMFIWLNGEEVFGHQEPRDAQPDQDVIPVFLNKGKNKLLIKVCNEEMNWGFYLRITKPGGAPMKELEFGE